MLLGRWGAFFFHRKAKYKCAFGCREGKYTCAFGVSKKCNVNVFCSVSGFLFVFGAGDKFCFFRAGEEEERKRDGEREKFCRRSGKPKSRHLP